jgi:hypothetical protein
MRVAQEACSATLDLGTNSAYADRREAQKTFIEFAVHRKFLKHW